MATYTSNYGWTKPSGSDNVDISVLNNNLDNQDSVIHNAFLNMAPPFSESSTYAVDDIVLYDTGLYKCHTAVVTPGSWTGSTNWQVYKLSEGGGGGLTLGETSSTAYRGDRGKTAYDHSQSTGNPHGTTAADVGLGNVPNVATNDQEPTFTEASTRNNIASGEKLSVILGKIQKFFNDLKTVAFSGSYSDLTNKPSINSVELSGNKTSANLSLQNASTEITWADWIQKTSQEQETGDWRITDCPWADGDVSVDLMTQLWQNPSPSASFAAQDIVMDFSDYNCVFLVADGATIILSKNAIMTITVTPISAGGKVLRRWRTAKLHDAKITISDCTERIINTYGSAASDTTANNELVPRYIYGIKTTASVKINAIAMDVSTSADKCMLSDGVTSVEDRFNSHGVTVKSVTADGIKTLSAILDELYSARSIYNYIDFNGIKAYPATTIKYSAITCSNTGEPVIYSIILKQSGTICKVHTMSSAGTSWTTSDISNNVPTQGNTYSVRTMY